MSQSAITLKHARSSSSKVLNAVWHELLIAATRLEFDWKRQTKRRQWKQSGTQTRNQKSQHNIKCNNSRRERSRCCLFVHKTRSCSNMYEGCFVIVNFLFLFLIFCLNDEQPTLDAKPRSMVWGWGCRDKCRCVYDACEHNVNSQRCFDGNRSMKQKVGHGTRSTLR